MTDSLSFRGGSPSGLFTKQAWAEAEGRDAVASHRPNPEGERAFARWVHRQAKDLAAGLERLAPPATPRLASQINALAEALWADAEWARRCLDQSAQSLTAAA